ncbi:MAG: Ig-like domain-containing protein [Anaerolineaceae bacterium]
MSKHKNTNKVVSLLLIMGLLFAALPMGRVQAVVAEKTALSESSVAENEPINTVVGTFSTTGSEDPDNTFTYTLVSGEGATDNAKFNILGDKLRTSEIFNYEVMSEPYTYSVRVRTTDPWGESYDQVFPITVTDVNEAPVLGEIGNKSINEGMELSFTAAATDEDEDALTFSLVGKPEGAEINVDETPGKFSWTPTEAQGPGEYTFDVCVSDEDLSDCETIVVTVDEVNVAPEAVADNYGVVKNIQRIVAAPGVLSNDVDTDLPANTLTAVLVTNIPAGTGTLVLASDGSFTYTPSTGQTAEVTFSYRVYDGKLYSEPVNVTLTIRETNADPTDITLSSNTIAENLPMDTEIGTLTTTDEDDNTSTYTLVSGEGDTDNAMFNIVGDKLRTSAIFNYEVKSSYNIRVRTTDQFGALYEEPLTITVTDVNDAPVLNPIGDKSVNEKTLLTFTATAADEDLPAQALTFSLVGEGVPEAATINIPTSGVFRWTPTEKDGPGTYTFSVKVCEVVEEGEAACDEEEITVTVNEVNDAPVAVDDVYETPEDTELVVDAENGVLVNDTDADKDELTVILVENVTEGTLALAEDGSFVYTPAVDFSGTDDFTYQAFDGSAYSEPATVTITVTSVNDVPVATADDYSMLKNQTLEIAAPGVLVNDTDADKDELTVILVENVTEGTLALAEDGSFVYTPAVDFSGTDDFTYQAFDGSAYSGPATVTIKIKEKNDEPTDISLSENEVAENKPINTVVGTFTTTDDDAEGTHTYTLVSGETYPDNAKFNIDGNSLRTSEVFNYEAMSAPYTYNILVRTTDPWGKSYAKVFLITVTDVNDAPIADDMNVETLAETALPITLTGSDEDGDELIFAIFTQPAHGTLSGTLPDLIYTPTAGYIGTDSFTFKVSDGILKSNLAIVSINNNDIPVAVDDVYETPEDTELVVDAENGVLANDNADLNGDPLTAELVENATKGTLTLAADGSFVYTPAVNFFGTDVFTYKAFDGSAYSEPATVTITVTSVNDGPVAVNDVYETDQDVVLEVAAPGVLANDTDQDPYDVFTAETKDEPLHGTLVLNADGSFTYTPDLGFFGTDTFTYWMTSVPGPEKVGTDLANPYIDWATVTITVHLAAPVAVDDVYETPEDTELVVDAENGVLANDNADLNGDPLTAELVENATKGTLTLAADGSFVYTPAVNFFGTDVFTYKAFDGSAYSEPATVTITVTSVNDGPAAVNDVYETDQDVVLEVAAPGVLANDTDQDPYDVFTAETKDEPLHGTLVLNADGSFTYTPDLGFFGTDTFTYWMTAEPEIGTDSAYIDWATVTITVHSTEPLLKYYYLPIILK